MDQKSKNPRRANAGGSFRGGWDQTVSRKNTTRSPGMARIGGGLGVRSDEQ